ncbi:aldehyde dehydrogenase family protein [Chitinimonas viridis]|uniref:Aldehyde dehydrogenase family protein n=1 Tax=Chitinimonas viridis TaxID=664880 RepID=A0ABT8BA05_9NEIS|nr:aldehyde dehydrogenase family protein [Chitinimonas viridis]MDN3578635.1 aldehyde dehydrogenase family protein [Chitinimonas viridis]
MRRESSLHLAATLGSVYFSARQLRGLNRLGDGYCPGGDGLPSFSASGAGWQIDRLAEAMHPQDRADLGLLLDVAASLPQPLLAGLLRLFNQAEQLRLTPLRLARLGAAGVVYSLYYGFAGPGGTQVRDRLGWDAAIRTQIPGEPVMNQLVRDAAPDLAVDATEVAAVFDRARAAQTTIAALGLPQRLALLDRLGQVVLRRREEIIARVSQETGKCASDALLGEIFAVIDNLEYLRRHAAAVLADRKMPTPLAMLGKQSRVWYEPLGTILVIAPWNYPFYQAIVPISIAFAAGNAVVHKPSEYTPLAGLVESILAEAGFAPDWAQVVYGNGQIGSACLAQAPDKLFFTGSIATGKRVMAQAAELLVPVELELGGKDPMLVFADANLERAVAGAMWGAFTNTGQSCTSIERCYVARPLHERFVARLVEQTSKLTLGTGPDHDIGSMTTPMQIAIVREHLADALAKGAMQHTGLDWDGVSPAIPPIVLTQVNHEMRVMQEESFGPFLPVMAFDGEAEAVRLANQTIYGLSACVWGDDKAQLERVARQLKVGNVSINNHMITEGNHALPFGGTKQSGIGRFKGEDGLRGFCNTKAVMVDGNSAKIEANWYPFTTAKYQALDKMTVASRMRGLVGIIRFAMAGLPLESLANKLGRKGRQP